MKFAKGVLEKRKGISFLPSFRGSVVNSQGETKHVSEYERVRRLNLKLKGVFHEEGNLEVFIKEPLESIRVGEVVKVYYDFNSDKLKNCKAYEIFDFESEEVNFRWIDVNYKFVD